MRVDLVVAPPEDAELRDIALPVPLEADEAADRVEEARVEVLVDMRVEGAPL